MQNLQQHAGLSCQFANFALAGLGGANTTHSHAASLPFVINGVWGTAPTGTTTPTTNSAATDPGSINGVRAAGSALSTVAPATGFRAALVVWTIDAAGTKRIRSRGFFESLSGQALDLAFPDIPLTEIPVSYHIGRAGTTVSGTWTYGSSNWNATGMTWTTVVNVCGLPPAGSVNVTAS